jgi:hypothetical protein
VNIIAQIKQVRCDPRGQGVSTRCGPRSQNSPGPFRAHDATPARVTFQSVLIYWRHRVQMECDGPVVQWPADYTIVPVFLAWSQPFPDARHTMNYVNILYMIAYLPYNAQQNLTRIIGGATLITRVTAMSVLEIEFNEDSYLCFVHHVILFARLIMSHARNATRVPH